MDNVSSYCMQLFQNSIRRSPPSPKTNYFSETLIWCLLVSEVSSHLERHHCTSAVLRQCSHSSVSEITRPIAFYCLFFSFFFLLLQSNFNGGVLAVVCFFFFLLRKITFVNKDIMSNITPQQQQQQNLHLYILRSLPAVFSTKITYFLL